ncbi:MAG: hypothetical protein A2271_02410 [Candidatus Moranbacteria bacterium RIFOXYA12_FULL_35_19]|nr:MAG: hypothetical protein UR78_C0008G0030 [Candidatus Moranbacteria bacterium GW2011_GWF2_35_39]OGI30252.1 MAG: hypothetical protein A2343_00110 [Candidatus Moranbacteria bacterium RIFOXYB12_FULL_35_8]OGI35392.1 MAG: hypothetical protein A2271_02410 [Candidatus Moranbacteria bacterium RIFOXYA12_FULL_35_19]
MLQVSDKQFYEKLSARELSDQEVFEAKSNFVGFFDLLLQIDKRLNEKNNEQDNRNSNIADKA